MPPRLRQAEARVSPHKHTYTRKSLSLPTYLDTQMHKDRFVFIHAYTHENRLHPHVHGTHKYMCIILCVRTGWIPTQVCTQTGECR